MKTQGRLHARHTTLLVAAAALAALVPTPARAQDRGVTLYAGFAFLKTDDGNLKGARLSPEFRVNGFASLVGDASWEKGTFSSSTTTVTTFLGGLRLRRGLGGATVFVHALAGGVRTSSSVSPFGGVTISVADTGLGLDGGGGIDFNLGPSLKLRFGADYLRRRIDTGAGDKVNENDIRATVGFVF